MSPGRSSLKTLFTNTGSWGTGAGSVIDGVTHELVRRGHQPKVCFFDSGEPSPDADRYYGRPDLYHIIRFPLSYRGLRFPTFPLMIPDPNPRATRHPWTFKEMSDSLFAGYIEYLREVLRAVVDSLREEGFGLGALEAMACGTPVVVTPVGDMDNFAVGRVVPPADPAALAHAMRELLTLEETMLKRLGSEAHRTAARYSWRRNVSQRLTYYRVALAGC